jgi:hypothetical protein
MLGLQKQEKRVRTLRKKKCEQGFSIFRERLESFRQTTISLKLNDGSLSANRVAPFEHILVSSIIPTATIPGVPLSYFDVLYVFHCFTVPTFNLLSTSVVELDLAWAAS